MSAPLYSFGDAAAPYLSYTASMRMLVWAGSVQLPLAYALPTSVPRATSRLLQVQEPTVAIVVEWSGRRAYAKPSPPRISVLGSFVLAHANAICSGVNKDVQGNDILEASGVMVLYTSDRPESVILPALWFPWDGRYEATLADAPEYLYTPQDLGFGSYLPGVTTPVQKVNNPPPVVPSSTGNKLYI